MTYDESKCKKNGAVYLLKNPESLLESSVSEKRSLSRKNHDDVEEFSKKTKVVSTWQLMAHSTFRFAWEKRSIATTIH